MMDKLHNSLRISGKPKTIKHINQRLVLTLLQQNESMTATEVSSLLDLSKTTVTKIIGNLVEAGVVRSMGKGDSTEEGGKKPELYALNSNYRSIIFVCMSADEPFCSVLDLKCAVSYRATFRYSKPEDYRSCVRDVTRAVEDAVRRQNLTPEQVGSVVVSCSGVVDAQSGTIQYPVHFKNWGRNLPLFEDLRGMLGFDVPIIVDNACRLTGYGELLHRPDYADCRVAAIFCSATMPATGGSLMDQGQLLQGANGFAGELGHIVINPESRTRCSCGNYGCFETLVSSAAMLEYAGAIRSCFDDTGCTELHDRGVLCCEDLFDGANRGDPFARTVLDHIVRCFVNLIQAIILLFDPHHIILQGLYGNAGPYFLEELTKRVNAYPFFKIKRNLEISYSPLGADDVLQVGGAYYAINRLLNEGGLF